MMQRAEVDVTVLIECDDRARVNKASFRVFNQDFTLFNWIIIIVLKFFFSFRTISDIAPTSRTTNI